VQHSKSKSSKRNYVIIRAGPFSRDAMRTLSLQAKDVRTEERAKVRARGTNLGEVLADLTASQTVILAFNGSLPGGMANTRHIESGVTEGDSL